jgi:hypothetical protein
LATIDRATNHELCHTPPNGLKVHGPGLLNLAENIELLSEARCARFDKKDLK